CLALTSGLSSTYSEGPALCPQRYFYAEPVPNCDYSTAAGNEPFGRGVGRKLLSQLPCIRGPQAQGTNGGSDTLISIPRKDGIVKHEYLSARAMNKRFRKDRDFFHNDKH